MPLLHQAAQLPLLDTQLLQLQAVTPLGTPTQAGCCLLLAAHHVPSSSAMQVCVGPVKCHRHLQLIKWNKPSYFRSMRTLLPLMLAHDSCC